jgi:hypothetical protein
MEFSPEVALAVVALVEAVKRVVPEQMQGLVTMAVAVVIGAGIGYGMGMGWLDGAFAGLAAVGAVKVARSIAGD